MKKQLQFVFALLLFGKTVFGQTPYVGEIRLFAGNFAPAGWLFCDGSLLPIAENEVLFVLIGTTYGGDGQETFALPDLRGRVPVGIGNGPGLSSINIGQSAGSESVTLSNTNVPAHSHNAQITVVNGNATQSTPTATSNLATAGSMSGRSFVPATTYVEAAPDVTIASGSTSSVGASEPVSIMKPYIGINYIISLYGIFPSQN
jgi:microcystin-dependent protein